MREALGLGEGTSATRERNGIRSTEVIVEWVVKVVNWFGLHVRCVG